MNLKKVKLEDLKVSELKIQDIGKVTSDKNNLPRNVIFQGDQLITRPGARTFEKLIFDSDKTFNVYDHMVFTDCHYYKDGLKGQVFIIVDDDEITNIIYHFYIMWSNGQTQNIGKIYFTRASETAFGTPESFTLYKGKATRGCGLYLLVRLVYDNGQEDFVRMYELNANMNNWEYVYSNDFYIPTILAFGRGEKYYLAEESDKRISFSNPIKLESENILTDTFFAYYTTDGYSSTFELPHKNISQGAITAVYSDLVNEYSFSIDYGKSQSGTLTIDSKNYRLCCNRALGNVFFTDDKGVRTAPPFVGVENNLKITASRKESDDLIKLAAMSKCMSIPAGREGKGNQTVIFYGSLLDEGGKICWINSENPLYFPKNCVATPGNLSNKLEGAYTYKDKLYMYDRENLYSANIYTANNFDLPLILKGVSSINKVDYDKFTFNQTIGLPQEIINDTVTVFADRVIFAGKTGGIYEQNGNSIGSIKKIADISKDKFLPEFAVSYKNGYLLFKGREAYYYDISKERFSFWDLATDVMGGFSFSDECILFAKRLCKENRTLIYALYFDGNSDGAVSDYTNKPIKFSVIVQSRIICEFDTDDTYYKRLHTIVIDAKPSEETVDVNIFADQKYVNSMYINFKAGLKTINRGARFKKLTIHVIGEGLSFNGAKMLYYDGKTL